MRHFILITFIATLLFSCGQDDTKKKELELKERELALREKELNQKENNSKKDTTKIQNNQANIPLQKNTIKNVSEKVNFNLTKFSGSWMGEEADLLLIKVDGNSIIGYNDYDNDKSINFKGTAINDNYFETPNYDGANKNIMSIGYLKNNTITITTNGKKVYSFSRN